jgi:hypothetical protein
MRCKVVLHFCRSILPSQGQDREKNFVLSVTFPVDIDRMFPSSAQLVMRHTT